MTTGEDAVRAEDEKIRTELTMNGYPADSIHGAVKPRTHAALAEVSRSNGTAVIPQRGQRSGSQSTCVTQNTHHDAATETEMVAEERCEGLNARRSQMWTGDDTHGGNTNP